MKIAEIIASENLFTPKEAAILKEDVRRYLSGSPHDQSEFLASRASGQVPPARLHSFFRMREREENTCHILQYLLMFSEIVATCESRLPEPAAARQLAGFVRFQVDLLLQRDVRTAIMREYSQLGILKPGNLWYYEGRIDDTHRELSASLACSHEDGAAAVKRLCEVLEKLCLFWFDICRENVRRVRACDLYTYKLALILQHDAASPSIP